MTSLLFLVGQRWQIRFASTLEKLRVFRSRHSETSKQHNLSSNKQEIVSAQRCLSTDIFEPRGAGRRALCPREEELGTLRDNFYAVSFSRDGEFTNFAIPLAFVSEIATLRF